MKKMILAAAAGLALFGAGCMAEPAPAPYIPPKPTTPAAPTQTDTYNYGTSTTSNSTSTATTPTSTVTTPPPMTLAFPGNRPDSEINKKIRIKTTLGDIVIQMDPKAGPLAASNFVYLVSESFYDNTIFHRVIPGFMIQGGDPTGTGRGGPGYQFKNDPVSGLPTKTVTIQGQTLTAPVYEKGIVAMANAGRDTNGSQFFIMVGDYPLGPDYSIFGRVVEGQDVADKISLVQSSADRPLTEVKMLSVTIE